MKKKLQIQFTKMVAAGNDFIVLWHRGRSGGVTDYKSLAERICHRHYGIGADGLLVLSASSIADARMRIFNADGSEASMCGNGARCAAYAAANLPGASRGSRAVTLETLAGIINARVRGNLVRLALTEPKAVQLDIPLALGRQTLHVHFINTGVPHVVLPVGDLDRVDVEKLGRQIRRHSKFAPQGTNVNFIKITRSNSIRVRTYERGVESETLACGTGATASALIASCISDDLAAKHATKVMTRGGEILKVYYTKVSPLQFANVYLEGTASIICTGGYYV